MKTSTKFWLIACPVIIIALAAFVFFKWYFIPQEGVDAGLLNYCNHEGIIFKTEEGKLIQAGYNTESTTGAWKSNEFKFSVERESLADTLRNYYTGQQVKLKWKRYNGTLPWRGKEQYIVYDIVNVASLDSAQPTIAEPMAPTSEPSDDITTLPTPM